MALSTRLQEIERYTANNIIFQPDMYEILFNLARDKNKTVKSFIDTRNYCDN